MLEEIYQRFNGQYVMIEAPMTLSALLWHSSVSSKNWIQLIRLNAGSVGYKKIN